MIMSDTHRLLYLCPQKTGSTVVYKFMKEQLNGKGQNDWLHGRHNTIWEERFRPYYKFITVRHPFTRAISLWKFIMQRVEKTQSRIDRDVQNKPLREWLRRWLAVYGPVQMDFRTFLDDAGEQLQLHQGPWSECMWHIQQIPVPIDKIVHLERFEEELRDVPGFQDVELKPTNVGPSLEKPWHEYYDPYTIYKVMNYWPHDFLPLGYNPVFREVKAGKIFA